MSRVQSLAELAATRELAVLIDVPWPPAWYWRDDLEAQQRAGRRMHAKYGQPLADKCHYRPAERWVTHSGGEGVCGRAWTYRPPIEERSLGVSRPCSRFLTPESGRVRTHAG